MLNNRLFRELIIYNFYISDIFKKIYNNVCITSSFFFDVKVPSVKKFFMFCRFMNNIIITCNRIKSLEKCDYAFYNLVSGDIVFLEKKNFFGSSLKKILLFVALKCDFSFFKGYKKKLSSLKKELLRSKSRVVIDSIRFYGVQVVADYLFRLKLLNLKNNFNFTFGDIIFFDSILEEIDHSSLPKSLYKFKDSDGLVCELDEIAAYVYNFQFLEDFDYFYDINFMFSHNKFLEGENFCTQNVDLTKFTVKSHPYYNNKEFRKKLGKIRFYNWLHEDLYSRFVNFYFCKIEEGEAVKKK